MNNMIHIMETIRRLWQMSSDATTAYIAHASRLCGNCGISAMESAAQLWQTLFRADD